MNPAVDPSRWALQGTRAVLGIWLAFALALLAFDWPAISHLRANDPDDYMRLLEVRDWLAGQGWADVRQYRMDPPLGADMHWSRLVDLPIAALLWPARLLFGDPTASAFAMALVPLLQLLVAMMLLHRLLRALSESEGTALTAAALPLLFPVLTSNFMPMRIDHHGWQAVCGLGCALAMQKPGWRGAALAGAIAGLWLTISLEGLVLVLALAGLMALRWLRDGEQAFSRFCAALVLTGGVLALATRTLASLEHATVDQLSWPHLLAFAGAGGVAALAGVTPASERIGLRLAALVLAGAAGAAAILGGLGSAALDPFHGLDPVVRQIWLDNVVEGMPITRQDWSTRAMLAWTPLLVMAGWRLVPRAQSRRWDELALFALAACGLSLLLMRGAVAAQLLTVPFSALLIARLFPRAQNLRTAPARVLAMAACLTMGTPSLASAAGRWLDHHRGVSEAPTPVKPQAVAMRPAALGTASGCEIARLATLPRGQMFALLNLGPEILVRTDHTVVAGSYHRNTARMRDVIEAFSGDPARAAALVGANHARYIVGCAGDDEIHVYAARRPDNLANALLAGQPPAWLQSVAGFGGDLLVYSVRQGD